MITLNKLNGRAHSSYMEFFCLSTDTKPVDKYKDMIIGNGSVIYEIDTGIAYVYDETGAAWKKISSEGADLEEIKQRLDEIDEKVDEIELFKFPNATIVGAPHIDNGQVSEFSANDYLQFPFVVDFRDRPFEINFAFTTGSNVTTHQTLIDSKYGVAFSIDSRKFMMLASTNGTAWDVSITSATNSVDPNTTYYVRLSWDGEVYEMEHSLDNETFVSDGAVQNSSQPVPKTILIGVGSADTATPFPFYGSINLNRASLTIADIVVWQGMDDVGIASRMDVSMSNIDDAGKEVVRNLSPVQDVRDQREGVSYVQYGVAIIPYASKNKPLVSGLVAIQPAYGITTNSSNVLMVGSPSNESEIDKRTAVNSSRMSVDFLDYAVKAAMCDGKGAAWTAEEQAAAQQRIGIRSVEGVGF